MVFKFSVGDVLAVCWIIAFPDEGCLISAFWQVTIDAVVTDVQFTPGKPCSLSFDEVELHNFIPGFFPAQEFAGHFSPEGVWVFNGTLVHRLVTLCVDMRIVEICWNQMGGKFGHDESFALWVMGGY